MGRCRNPPSSEDLDPYPVIDAPMPNTPSTVKSRFGGRSSAVLRAGNRLRNRVIRNMNRPKSGDRADACAIAFAGKANAAPMNFESHMGESITADLMSKAW